MIAVGGVMDEAADRAVSGATTRLARHCRVERTDDCRTGSEIL
jgi:hypothetical protein